MKQINLLKAMKRFILLIILILNLQSWTKAEEVIDMIFGVKLNDDVSEYAKIENAKIIIL